MVRTRIAPSPTGNNLHIGNLYTALINYSFAKKNNGKFIIRIEDTDRERYIKEAENKILQTVKDYHLTYDEGPDIGGKYGPYRQSDRLSVYHSYSEKLIQSGNAYYCFCKKERLEALRQKAQSEKKPYKYDKHCLSTEKNSEKRVKTNEQFVIRLNVPQGKEIVFTDVIRGTISFQSDLIDDQILIKSDGYPTYHFAVVVDDYLMQISHIIRAEEWISSTPKHVLLYEAFGWQLPVFVHLPILRNPDKSKLSKRKNPVWASWFLEQGYLPEAVLNFLALMGWSHPKEEEIFTLDEFISLFNLEDIKPVGPIFDINKLNWMNGIYIRRLSVVDLARKLHERNKSFGTLNQNTFLQIVALAQTRMETLSDFEKLTAHFFREPKSTVKNETDKKIVENMLKRIGMISHWDKDTVLEILRMILQENNIKMPVLYRLLTGNDSGLPLPESLEILGKIKTEERLQNLLL